MVKTVWRQSELVHLTLLSGDGENSPFVALFVWKLDSKSPSKYFPFPHSGVVGVLAAVESCFRAI